MGAHGHQGYRLSYGLSLFIKRLSRGVKTFRHVVLGTNCNWKLDTFLVVYMGWHDYW